MIQEIEIKYSVGALLYSPALNEKIAGKIIEGCLGDKYSVALCLEDTVAEDSLEEAEAQVAKTIGQVYEANQKGLKYLPKIFVRVRNAGQLGRVFASVEAYQEVLTGFIFPKYSLKNADEFNAAIRTVNQKAHKKIYMMPILESGDIIDFGTRREVLCGIRDKIDSVRDYVLNVRVGGNDFSNEFAARRHCDETIYDILPIAHLLSDILTVFSRDYVVSGPVWEFFAGDNEAWKTGLMRELKLDRLNGFIGKTVIHPRQIAVVNEMLKVSACDYEDAKAILNWDDSGLQVGKSKGGDRMNEVRTHGNWAKKIMLLAELYGVK